jgi:Leucine-rich repeat (LRR) protein
MMWHSIFLTVSLFLIKILVVFSGHACEPSKIPGVFDIENCKSSKLGRLEYKMSLKEIKAFNNRITTIDNDTFRGAYNLASIDLSQNYIEDIQVGAFVDQAKLTHLYLSGNRLKSLKVGTFDPLKSLWLIDLHGNQISVLENETFVKSSYLTEVNLNFNKIFAIGLNAFSWKKLERLQLKDNICVNSEFYFSAFVDRFYLLTLQSNCFGIYESHKQVLREITESLNLTAIENELVFYKKRSPSRICKNAPKNTIIFWIENFPKIQAGS